ncbi:MAG TPA: hypothetical protein VGG06_03465 [Thermoanaerobaculia bacterium]|jgi:hypothetical protein
MRHQDLTRESKAGWLLALAWVVQGAMLVTIGGTAAFGFLALWLPLALVFPLVFRPGRLGLEACGVAASLGGLGMAVGTGIDLAAGEAHAAHGMPGHGVAVLVSWMAALMLVFCVAGCHRLCRVGRPALRFHLAAVLGMLAGMTLGGAALSGTLSSLAGSHLLGGHLAMLLGMTAGTAVGTGWLRPT